MVYPIGDGGVTVAGRTVLESLGVRAALSYGAAVRA
jgi:hypothetical protein